MLLTIAYMVYIVIRTQLTSKYKIIIRKAFENDRNHCSISFYPRDFKDDAEKGEKYSLTSNLCINRHLAQLRMKTTFDSLIAMHTIYPRQEINISRWLNYKNEVSFFPLYKLESCQISSKSDALIYVLIETALETYDMDTSERCTKIENYGIIRAWSIENENLNLLLETDIDHITSFMTIFIKGRYFINNSLFIKHVQSVVIKGKPCIYEDIKLCKLPWTRETLILLNNAANTAVNLKQPIEVTKFSGVFVHPQLNVDLKKDKLVEVPLESNPENEIEKKIDQVMTFTLTPVDTTDMQSALQKENVLKINDSDEEHIIIKPPNVLIYTDTINASKNIKAVLSKILDPERYIIYNLSSLDASKNTWMNHVALIVVFGNVTNNIADQFIEYIIRGGKVLVLCSNLLRILLPSFRTAELYENELVYFSYEKWKHVCMIHDIFCYQASPKRNRFSEDHEDARLPLSKLPQSTLFQDSKGNSHLFDVEILSEDETWQNPSILLATLSKSGGKIVFSQVHLEADPAEYEDKQNLFKLLKENNTARLEIITDLLSRHLNMEINHTTEIFIVYTPAYLLSKTKDLKFEMLMNLKNLTKNCILQMPDLKLQFYTNTNKDISEIASKNFLPIIMDDNICPINFSHKHYFETLKTKKLGQLVIYSDILTSSMKVMENQMIHGLAVIPRQQTQGQGRCSNIWLSPVGCAMFTLQIHISMHSILGKQISILQHVVAVAMISAIRSIPGYEDINLKIKWPNDIYVGKIIKIGGLIVHTRLDGLNYICNIGAGINLSNNKPTTCINDVISQYNQKYKTNLEKFSYEKYLALVFNQLEILLDDFEKDNFYNFFNLYYRYWMHKNENVSIIEQNGDYHKAKIIDIDNFGFLRVRTCKHGINVNMVVHPDRNSFDLLKGLIVPI